MSPCESMGLCKDRLRGVVKWKMLDQMRFRGVGFGVMTVDAEDRVERLLDGFHGSSPMGFNVRVSRDWSS